VTSNHVHLVIRDDKGEGVIPQTMQLVAGRAGQEYNQRKNRKGAFWEDRYHATAVEVDSHLSRCMVYIDLNMVRAGIVTHPSEWPFCGYNEIKNPRERYSIIDYESLIDFFNAQSMDELRKTYRVWVEEALEKQSYRKREPQWTESIAVGNEVFVRETKEKLGIKAIGREVIGVNGSYELREPETVYEVNFSPENMSLSGENMFFWDVSFSGSIG